MPNDAASLQAQVDERLWYHSLELAPGVVTPGWFDHRGIADTFPWPDLRGRRCLDVGTFDGFWAFYMERGGAAEVIAVDELDPALWDWPEGSSPEVMEIIAARNRNGGFQLAHEALGSSVERRHVNVYDLDPDAVGTFDVVYVGSLLLHLRDPLRALAAVRSVCRPGATVLLVDAIDLELTLLARDRPVAWLDGLGRHWWWKPNLAGLARFAESSGLRVLQRQRLYMPAGAGQATPRPALRDLRSHHGRLAAVTWRRGDPHGLVLAQRPH